MATPLEPPFVIATACGLPGTISMSAGDEVPVLNCKPAVWLITSNRRAALAPSRCTQIVWPSSEIAILFGSLPTNVDGPTAPVSGVILVMLLPFALALLGTLA